MTDEQLLDAIDRFAAFPDNWDSYGSKAYTPKTIEYAKSFVSVLREHQLDVQFVSPGDGLVFYHRFDEKRIASVEVFPSGERVAAMTSRDNHDLAVWTLNAQNLNDSLERIKVFISNDHD